MKLINATTQVRYAPPSRERLMRLAKAGSRLANQPGPLHSPNVAAICEALMVALVENEVLRRDNAKLRGAQPRVSEWADEPTRRQETDPGLIRRTTRTGMVGIPQVSRDD